MSKLICISTTAYNNGQPFTVSKLKIGKLYDGVLTKMNDGRYGYYITGLEGTYSAYLFSNLAEWREEQINSILDE